MQRGKEGLFRIQDGNSRVSSRLHRLGDKSVTKLRKCVIIVAGLSNDHDIECRMLENSPTGLERAETELILGNQYNRLLRQQQGSKALSALKGITTTDRREKNRKPRNRFEDKCFSC